MSRKKTVGEAQLKIELKMGQLNANLKKAKERFTELCSAMEQLNKALPGLQANLDKAMNSASDTATISLLKKEIEDLKTKMAELQAEAKNTSDSIEKETMSLYDLMTAYKNSKSDIQAYKEALAYNRQGSDEYDAISEKIKESELAAKKAKAGIEEYSQAYKKLAKELNTNQKDQKRLNNELETAVKKYGKNSDEAMALRRELKLLRDEQYRLKNELKGSGYEFEEQSKDIDKAKISLKDYTNKTQNLSGALTILKGILLGTAFRKMSEIFIGGNAEIENYTTSFDVLLGSYERANNLINRLYIKAAETPFELTDLAEAEKLLLSFGFTVSESINYLNQLGDVSLGNATKMEALSNAFGKIKSRTNATMRELNQFITNGVPIIGALAETIGVTEQEIRKMVTAGEIGFEDVAAALKHLTSEGGLFYKGLEKQSKTFTGLTSTLADNLNLLGREIGEGAFILLKDELKNLINELETLNETGELDEFKERLGNALTLIVETLINLLDLLIENKETILDIVEVLISFKLGAFAANTALGALSGTMKTFESVTTSAYAILNQFSFALTAMAAVGVYEFNQVKLAEQELIGSTKQVIKENENLVKSYNKNVSMLDINKEKALGLSDELELLMKIENKSVEEKEAIASVIEQLNAIYPELNMHYSDERDELNKNIKSLDDYIKSYKSYAELKSTQSAYEDALSQQTKLQAEWEVQSKKLKEIIAKDLEIDFTTMNTPDFGEWLESAWANTLNEQEFAVVKEALEELAVEIKENEEFVEILENKITELAGAEEDLGNKTNNLTNEEYEINEETERLVDLTDKYLDKINGVTEALEDEEGAYEDTNEKQVDYLKNLELLNDAINENQKEGKLSSATLMKLVEIYPDLLEKIELTADGYRLESDMLDILKKKAADTANAQIASSAAATAQIISDIEKQMEALELANPDAEYTELSPYAYHSKLDIPGYDDLVERRAKLQELLKKQMEDSQKLIAIQKGTSYEKNNTGGSKNYEKQYEKEIRDLKYKYDMELITAEEYYNKLEKIVNTNYANGSKEWQNYTVQIKQGRDKLTEEARKALKQEYEDRVDAYEQYTEDEEFYGRLSSDDKIKRLEDEKKIIADAYNKQIITYKEYAAKIREIDKDIYSTQKEAFQDAYDDIEKLRDDKYKKAVDAINRYYDDIEAAEEARERERTLDELRKTEALYEGAVSRAGQEKLKSIQEDIRQLEMEKAKTAREAARTDDLEKLEEEYDKLKDYQDDYFNAVKTGAYDTAEAVRLMAEQINKYFNNVARLVGSGQMYSENNNNTNIINQTNNVYDAAGARGVIDMTKIMFSY